jgi:hypothetical protein
MKVVTEKSLNKKISSISSKLLFWEVSKIVLKSKLSQEEDSIQKHLDMKALDCLEKFLNDTYLEFNMAKYLLRNVVRVKKAIPHGK